MNKEEKIKAIKELLKHTDMSAWEGVEKYRATHNGQLPPEEKQANNKPNIV